MKNSRTAFMKPGGELEHVGGLGRIRSMIRFCRLLGASFTSHQGTLRAAALTYTTALSLIPVLAIACSILKGLGAQNTLEPLLLNLAGDSQETISRIIGYVNNTNFKSVGAIGVLMLIFTAISLLGDIELSFNAIWGVRETRSLQRRFSDYLSVVVVGPVLILVATSVTTSLQNQSLVQWLIRHTTFGRLVLFAFKLTPYLSIWIALIFLYTYIPNTKVKFRSALLGGILAGTAWQVAQWIYFHFQVGLASYNAIYGTLAALPIFLIWVNTSWLIVLFGVEFVCAHHHRRHCSIFLTGDAGTSQTAREQRALAVMLLVCEHFRTGGGPPDSVRLADELSLRQDLVEDSLELLEAGGCLVASAGNEPGWLPAREPSLILVSDLLQLLRGEVPSGRSQAAALAAAERVVRGEADCARASLGGMNIYDLLDRERSGNN